MQTALIPSGKSVADVITSHAGCRVGSLYTDPAFWIVGLGMGAERLLRQLQKSSWVLSSDGGEEEDGPDAEEIENDGDTAALHDGSAVLLRGFDILRHLRRLRSHGADHELMTAWCDAMVATQQRRCPRRSGSTTRTSMTSIVSNVQRVSSSGPFACQSMVHSAAEFTEWVVPVCVHQRMAGSGRADSLAVAKAWRGVLEAILDGRRVLEVLVRNGYKAATLQRLISRCRDANSWRTRELSGPGCSVLPFSTDRATEAFHRPFGTALQVRMSSSVVRVPNQSPRGSVAHVGV